jgi:hypothetical protein
MVVAARPSPGTRTPMYSFRRVPDRLCVGYTFSPGCTSVKAPAGSRSCARGVKCSSLRRVFGAPEPPVEPRDRGAVIRSTPPTTSLGDARRMRWFPRRFPEPARASQWLRRLRDEITPKEFSRRESEMLKSQIRGKWEILSEQTVRGSKDGIAICRGISLADSVVRRYSHRVPGTFLSFFIFDPGTRLEPRRSAPRARQRARVCDVQILSVSSGAPFESRRHRKHAGLACGWRETNARDVDLWRTDTVEP